MTPDSVTLDCPAKVNLALSVGAVDAATGLHPLASWMVAVDLCDTLTVRRLPAGSPSTATICFAHDALRREQVDWPIDRDLAVRAHRACEAHLGHPLPVAIELTKRIPTGGGLGGGSSNAAGVLVALSRLFDSPLGPGGLKSIAHPLGSDVPFALAALTGTPSAVVSGLGDTLAPAPTPGGHLVLVIPPFGCPTGQVFAAFDQTPQASNLLDEAHLVRCAAQYGPHGHGDLGNDLYAAAQTVEPRLPRLLDAIMHCVDLPPQVTGAGAVCFLHADSADHARRLADTLAASTDPHLAPTTAVPVRFPFSSPTP